MNTPVTCHLSIHPENGTLPPAPGFQPPSPWMQTAGGRAFPLLNPTPADIHWEDVAAGLGRQTRYNGHTQVVFFSIAEHSIRGAEYIGRPDRWDDQTSRALAEVVGNLDFCRRAFLLHDAHEAYTGDWTSPVKEALAAIDRCALAALKRLQAIHDAAVHARAGMPWPLPTAIVRAVKYIDLKMLATEQRDLCAPPQRPWVELPTPIARPITRPMGPGAAEAAMLTALEAEGWPRG